MPPLSRAHPSRLSLMRLTGFSKAGPDRLMVNLSPPVQRALFFASQAADHPKCWIVDRPTQCHGKRLLTGMSTSH